MTDTELCIAIAILQDYEEHVFVHPDTKEDEDPCDHIYDAEYCHVPNYIKALTRVGAEQLLILLNGVKVYKDND